MNKQEIIDEINKTKRQAIKYLLMIETRRNVK